MTNTPNVLTEATAELTWGLILTLARRIAEGDRLIRRGDGRAGRSISCWGWSCAASSSASSAAGGLAARWPRRRRVRHDGGLREARHVARRAARQLRRGLHTHAGHPRHAPPDRPPDACANEAIGAAREYGSRLDCRRSGARVGAARTTDRRRRARRLRQGTVRPSGAPSARERRARAAPRERHAGNTDRDGRSGGQERPGGAGGRSILR